jgi:replicative DNA helicase
VNKLFTKSLECNSIGFLISMPQQLFTKSELKWLGFVRDFTLKYSVPPTVERLEREFSDFLRVTSSDPLEDIYYQEVGHRRNTLTREALIKNSELLKDGEDPYSFIADLTKNLAVPTSEIIDASVFDVTEYMRSTRRYNFGFPYVDDITGGITEGDLVYLFGRPGSGKTSVLIDLIAKWAVQGLNVLVISNEIKYVDLMYKVHATIAGVDQTAKRKGALSNEDILKIRAAQNILAINNNLQIVRHPVTNVGQIIPLLTERKIDILCIDGVYLMSPSGKPSSDWKDLAEVSRFLKQTANNMGISIVGVIQGSRVNENGITAAGVAGTDAFLQDADILFGVEKESIAPGERVVGFKCVKNRNGIAGNVTLTITFPLFSVTENEQ